jgi:hypothetical protein
MAKKPLSFKDFLTVDYAPGQPELVKKNAKKRKVDSGGGTNAEYQSVQYDDESLEEALTLTQRRKKALTIKRLMPRIQVAIKKARKKTASMEKIKLRARRAARKLIFKKLAKSEKGDVSFQRRQDIEKRLDKMAPVIDRIARKMIPKERQMDIERKRAN